MNKSVTIAAMLGFAAPLTVAAASGVHYGDSSAGWFMAASWFCALAFGGFAKLVESMGNGIAE